MARVCFSLLPKLAASPPSLKSPPVCAKQHQKQTLKLPIPSLQTLSELVFTQLLKPNTQTQVPQMCGVRAAQFLAHLSHRTRTICFISEAIWSERSHQGMEQRVENRALPSAFCNDIRSGSQERGAEHLWVFIPQIPAEHLKAAFAVILDLCCI